MRVAIDTSPPVPSAGESVIFTIRVDDADGNVTRLEINFGEGQGGMVETLACLAPVIPYHGEFQYSHIYENASRYTVTVRVHTEPCYPVVGEDSETSLPLMVT